MHWVQQQVKSRHHLFPLASFAAACSRIEKGRSGVSSHLFLSSMETISPSTSNFDEFSMEQSLLFSDSLKDLKNLKLQLYSAAEYFELSYTTDDHNQFVVNTLKEYAIKALANTVDHLGSVSFKVNSLFDEKADEVSGAEFRVSSIKQRIQRCQELVDREGLSQQSLVIEAPRYHKQYILPVGESMPESGRHAVPKYENLNSAKDNTELHKFQAVHPTLMDKPPSFRKMCTMSHAPSSRAHSLSPRKMRFPSPSQQPGQFFSIEKKATSSIPMPNPLAPSGSLAVRPAALNSLNFAPQYSLPIQKSASIHLHAERNDQKDSEQNPSKSGKFLKSLLGRRKSKKDDMLYNYVDEY